MNSDPVSDAFRRWKDAHDAFLAAEKRLFEARAPITVARGTTPNPLLDEVQKKRLQADNLLMAAMKLLHETRHRNDGADSRDAARAGGTEKA